MQARGIPMPLPSAPPQLAAWLDELGLYQAGGMGIAPVSFSELAAWHSTHGHACLPGELALLRAASVAYVQEYSAERPISPMQERNPEQHAAQRQKTLSQQLSQLTKQANAK